MSPRIALTDLSAEEIARTFNLQPYQGRQIFAWLHRRRVFDFDAMTDLSKDLRERLHAECLAPQISLLDMETSARTGTRKALFQLSDGETVESVFLRDGDRVTLCVSSQVGCACRCAFCATGDSGFRRQCTPGEIVEQVLHLLDLEDLAGRVPNIVYMGMGEPFQNYDTVAKSIRLLMAKEGLGIGARRITVSTAGDVPGIGRFAQEGWQVRLAISLHAANDRLRSRLVPLNRRYPLAAIMEAARRYASSADRLLSFEWVLMQGINDSEDDAEELATLIAGVKSVVNLIPCNPVDGKPYKAPSPSVCAAFQAALTARGVAATLRQERGQDIKAACGQLRARKLYDSR
ncbi:MAG TPA: 23S rRNA (adenine(2503)-C(2))-methyltransferase RlmN [Candidatus Hydrogenedentes bacterium]|nr:23S rRNA (adenine(2503)-C(2))-methyltransferase RlmN [Candidatus Hydrogenedentota bacterium]HRT19521.1 23S rRNA (adenine(2503)-C(2))-methyltransferase RlmN [Candidatus Hydrogenedentota bacterium]HRT64223.1 23S rRNA (adenine(2503)-C(2))-methyltransferase RlmN [Candidatus Hydrogenedentota bacterium]